MKPEQANTLVTDPVLNFLRTVGWVPSVTCVGLGGVEVGVTGVPHLLLITERALSRDHEVEEAAISQGTE